MKYDVFATPSHVQELYKQLILLLTTDKVYRIYFTNDLFGEKQIWYGYIGVDITDEDLLILKMTVPGLRYLQSPCDAIIWRMSYIYDKFDIV